MTTAHSSSWFWDRKRGDSPTPKATRLKNKYKDIFTTVMIYETYTHTRDYQEEEPDATRLQCRSPF